MQWFLERWCVHMHESMQLDVGVVCGVRRSLGCHKLALQCMLQDECGVQYMLEQLGDQHVRELLGELRDVLGRVVRRYMDGGYLHVSRV